MGGGGGGQNLDEGIRAGGARVLCCCCRIATKQIHLYLSVPKEVSFFRLVCVAVGGGLLGSFQTVWIRMSKSFTPAHALYDLASTPSISRPTFYDIRQCFLGFLRHLFLE